MTHPLDEALAEARRALDLEKFVAAKGARFGFPKEFGAGYVEKWTRIEKALVEAISAQPCCHYMCEPCPFGHEKTKEPDRATMTGGTER